MVAQLVSKLKEEVLEGLDLPPVGDVYKMLSSELPAASIENEAHHQAALKMSERLIDFCQVHGGNPEIYQYLDALTTFIELYEKNRFSIKKPKPAEMLGYLMNLHDLRQTDLSEELGGQSIVSELLNEKREFNLRQIRLLADRFHVSPMVFI